MKISEAYLWMFYPTWEIGNWTCRPTKGRPDTKNFTASITRWTRGRSDADMGGMRTGEGCGQGMESGGCREGRMQTGEILGGYGGGSDAGSGGSMEYAVKGGCGQGRESAMP